MRETKKKCCKLTPACKSLCSGKKRGSYTRRRWQQIKLHTSLCMCPPSLPGSSFFLFQGLTLFFKGRERLRILFCCYEFSCINLFCITNNFAPSLVVFSCSNPLIVFIACICDCLSTLAFISLIPCRFLFPCLSLILEREREREVKKCIECS